jgi:hypothetical protein
VRESSFQSAKKIGGLNDADIPEGFQFSQMAIAGNDQVSATGYGAFQNPVICGVLGNHLQSDRGADDLGNFGYEFQLCHDFGFLPLQNIPENVRDFAQDSGGNEQNEIAVESLPPNPKRRA